jgi:SOS response regulatory protein OraA/RecX
MELHTGSIVDTAEIEEVAFREQLSFARRDIMDEVLAERDERDLHQILVKTVRNRYGYLERQRGLRRAKAYLQRRGFQYDLISSIMDEVFRNSEEQTD